MKNKLSVLSLVLIIGSFNAVLGQGHITLTEADYDRASAMLSSNLNKYIDKSIRPQWLPDSRLWYSCKTDGQTEYKLYDPARGKMRTNESRSELFEKAEVIISLSFYLEINLRFKLLAREAADRAD